MTRQLSLLEEPSSEQFRPVQYLGNKWRVREAIRALVSEVAPRGPACDLFTGSGVVAATLATQRPVVAADVQEYSRVLASALLTPASPPDDLLAEFRRSVRAREEELRAELYPLIAYEQRAMLDAANGDADRLCEIVEIGSIAGYQEGGEEATSRFTEVINGVRPSVPQRIDSVLSRYYGGVYFSYEQALQLDAITAAARGLPAPFRDSVLASALSTASETVSSVGNHFAQPPRPRLASGQVKPAIIGEIVRHRQRDVHSEFDRWNARYSGLPTARFQHVIVRQDYRLVLAQPPNNLAVIYADPPYTRDHYSRFYHVLETMAVGDEPGVTSTVGSTSSRGLYRVERHQSPFSIASQVVEAFTQLIRGSRDLEVPLIVSYSPYLEGSVARPRPRLLTIDQIVEMLADMYARVEVHSPGPVAHSKLNRREVNIGRNGESELLIVARP